jgi:hypothetical protein
VSQIGQIPEVDNRVGICFDEHTYFHHWTVVLTGEQEPLIARFLGKFEISFVRNDSKRNNETRREFVPPRLIWRRVAL